MLALQVLLADLVPSMRCLMSYFGELGYKCGALMNKTETAILAGGCFWCLEAVFQEVRGVIWVTPGYLGGSTPAPDYTAVCSGLTGHAEAVAIEFDSEQISYRELLEVFFAIHDSTQLNRQGNDIGSQYRSVVFWADQSQRIEAERMIAQLECDRVFGAPIMTRLERAGAFHIAETEHHDYFRQHTSQPYCAYVIAPKLDKFRSLFQRIRCSSAEM